MRHVFVVHGPNLNLLGTREPQIYGSTTLAELEDMIGGWAAELGFECSFFQSNHEGALIDALQEARERSDAVILNGGALTHYSYALYDALVAIAKPVVEVHISNIHGREDWRRRSVTAPAANHVIYGRGLRGYHDALLRLAAIAAGDCSRIAYGAAESQYGELRVPDGPGPHPVAVLIHGGFWREMWTLDLMDSLAIDLTARGWATWNIEYHRVGGGGGWPLTLEDVAAAMDHLRELADAHRLDLADVTTIGHSAGGQLALWAAARPELPDGKTVGADAVRATRVVALAPVADLAEAHRLDLGDGAAEAFLRRSPETGVARYAAASPIQLLPLGCPQLVVHGDLDDRVPVLMSQEYLDAARAAGDEATLHLASGADHFVIIDPASDEWNAVLDWLVS